MHEKPVPLTEHGLVDPTYLLEYMPDDPRKFGFKAIPGYEFHHLWFSSPNYNNKKGHNTNKPHVDQAFVDLRGSPYSQVFMRDELEDQMHRDYEMDVPRPDIDIARQYNSEVGIFNALGAASMGLVKRNYQGYFVRTTAGRRETESRLDYFEERREAEIQRALNNVVVIPELLANSALTRVALKLRDPLLLQMANKFITNGNYLPIRAPSHRSFRVMADKMFERHVATIYTLEREPEPAFA